MSFIGITFLSITKDRTLKALLLTTVSFLSHAAENLAQALKAVLIDCSLDESHISVQQWTMLQISKRELEKFKAGSVLVVLATPSTCVLKWG